MFSTLDTTKNNQQVSWEQRLLKNSGRQKASLKPEYQELKFTLHRKLVDKINLEALATIDNQRVRSEVRQAVIALIMMGIELAVARATFGLPVGAAVGRIAPVLIACAVMAVAVHAVSAPLAPYSTVVELAGGVAAGSCVYALALFLVARRFVATGLAVLRGALDRRQPSWEGAQS